jgi:hypothetical protein
LIPLKTLKRINAESGREEVWIQPPGLPGIWIENSYCLRCEQFNQCLGLQDLSESECANIENLIPQANKLFFVKEVIKERKLKTC